MANSKTAASAAPELVIISVNYKTPELAIGSIQSVLADAENLPPFVFHVVDNCSGDGSAEKIQQFIDDNDLHGQVKLSAVEKNGGYAFGNNVALKPAYDLQPRPKYFWLLNPDTRVYPEAGKALIDFLDARDEAGMVVSRLEDEDGTPQVSAFRFPSPLNEFLGGIRLGVLDRLFPNALIPMPIQSEPHKADWLAGASMMMKSDVVTDIGFMDDDYFLYFEELDYCLQANRTGWECWSVPNSRVFHVVGAATGISDLRKQAPRRPQYWFNSRRRFFVKNFSKPYAMLADLGGIVGWALWRVRQKLERKPDLDPPHFLSDLLRNSVFLRGFDLDDGDGENGLLALIREDWKAHGEDWTKPGFRAMAIYRFGVWRMGIRSKWLRAPLSLLYRAMFRRARNVWGIELPYSAKVGRRVVIEHQGGIVIHGNAEIGDDSIVRQGVTIGNRNLSDPFAAPVIGAFVNIGAGAVLAGDINVGDNAVIGANAVILEDVPEGALAVGVPARIKSRKPTGIEEEDNG